MDMTTNIGEKMVNNKVQRRKSFISGSFKFLLAAASIAGTVGLWGVFSKKDAQASATTLIDAQLPALMPLVTVNPVNSIPVSTNNTTISSLPVVTQPATNYSSAPLQLNQPAPVTSTRSSRP
jgi:hypothetical protein